MTNDKDRTQPAFPVRTCEGCGWKTTSTSTLDRCLRCKTDGLRPRHFLTRDHRIVDFIVGDRVEATKGDARGLRGFVTAVDLADQTPIHWRGDDGSRIQCVAERIRHVDPNPVGWVPRCGDRVRVLVKDLRGRSAYVCNTENPERVFVAVPSRGHAMAGPYRADELELNAPAKPGPQETQS